MDLKQIEKILQGSKGNILVISKATERALHLQEEGIPKAIDAGDHFRAIDPDLLFIVSNDHPETFGTKKNIDI